MSRYVFPHQRLHAYRHALALAVACDAISRSLPRGYGHIADQLRRASSSVAIAHCAQAHRLLQGLARA